MSFYPDGKKNAETENGRLPRTKLIFSVKTYIIKSLTKKFYEIVYISNNYYH